MLAIRGYTPSRLALERVPQRVEFTEPSTKTRVVLIGTMHYNPASIELARSTVELLGEGSSLYSVVIESCEGRWSKAMKSQTNGSLMAKLFPNEMRAASDVAVRYNRPVILGDQDFNATTQRIKEVFVQSVKDVATPFDGWKRLYGDLTGLLKQVVTKDADNFGLSDIFDPRLLSTAPIAILRYASSILIKAPKFGIPVFALLMYSVVQSLADDMSGVAAVQIPESEIFLDSFLTSSINVLEVALLGRVILQALLQERNEILAENIFTECKKAAALGSNNGDTVVAVLGMAHCNGVMDILLNKPK
jgi:hypothetical protein